MSQKPIVFRLDEIFANDSGVASSMQRRTPPGRRLANHCVPRRACNQRSASISPWSFSRSKKVISSASLALGK